MIPHDHEDDARIRRHLKEREGWGFETVEQGVEICQALTGKTTGRRPVDPSGVFLLDSVTALLSNEMFRADGTMDLECGQRLAAELIEFAKRTGNTIFVSDYIYSDANKFDEFTETYRSTLAMLDRTLARVCDQVIEVTYGFTYTYK